MGAKHQDSISMIKEAFSNLAKTYHLTINDSWYKDYYQMMNRLVAVDFLNRKGYQAFLINVYFIHGYEINAHGNPLKHNLSVPTREAWLQIIEKQYQELGLNDSFIKQYIKTVFIEC